MIGKCACTLVNLRHTKASEAIFTTTHSGRLWPTLPPSHDDHKATAPAHPLEIDGPTLVWRLERVPAPSSHETTIQFLRRVSKSQDEMVAHTHAPLGKVLRGLLSQPPQSEGEENKANSSADTTLINRILFHQLFNWVLEKINNGSMSSTADSPLRVVDMLSQADLSLVWAPCLRPDNVCGLDIRYRHGQFEAGEVESLAREFLDTMAWLAEPGNLDRSVVECVVSCGDVAAAAAAADGVGNGVADGVENGNTTAADGIGNGTVGDGAGDSNEKDEDADNEGRRKRRKLCT
ncbi:hypothetical protein P168DRAFT_314534 [Aspergillus campestris IBT 28561]|uniref:Uncharacterized protein n=1 Tax=Aspergillus campestris (strain IBT 28561) TaxID=1392248 RepID=A0A2I1DF10_ASPC2|nr:uncharacterized protein P168DRAFT_314534 [Aspergillus campestris IBT 28561]PKY08440.1 hypothetical protein P168DRAFT_314534 [Aspergillus campestris IBT 28561]